MVKKSIAYIDDSQSNLDLMSIVLRTDFEVEAFTNPDEFLEKYPRSQYVAILLDVHMPKISGFDLYDKVVTHPQYNGSPVLFISSDDSDEARIKSFSLGAVDFMRRRTSAQEILARVKSTIEFFNKNRTIMELGGLRLNLTLLKAFLNHKEISLTFIEFKILTLALKSYPVLVDKQQVIDFVWNRGVVLDATLYTHIWNLNSKMPDWEYEVITIKGKGIQLQKKDSSK